MKRLLLKMNLFMLIVYMTFFNFMQTVKAQEKQFENEIILIDPSIKNVETITHALKPNVKVLYFDDHTPMLTSISNALQSNAPVKSSSIVTHGNDGMIPKYI